jgi:hypothetical protein
MDRNTYLAQKQQQVKPIIGWRVKMGHVVYYEGTYGLCSHYKSLHGLNRATITPKY